MISVNATNFLNNDLIKFSLAATGLLYLASKFPKKITLGAATAGALYANQDSIKDFFASTVQANLTKNSSLVWKFAKTTVGKHPYVTVAALGLSSLYALRKLPKTTLSTIAAVAGVATYIKPDLASLIWPSLKNAYSDLTSSIWPSLKNACSDFTNHLWNSLPSSTSVQKLGTDFVKKGSKFLTNNKETIIGTTITVGILFGIYKIFQAEIQQQQELRQQQLANQQKKTREARNRYF